MIRLKYEANARPVQFSTSLFRQFLNRLIVKQVFAFGGFFEQTQNMQQSGLPRSRRAHYGHKLALNDVEVDITQHIDPTEASRVELGNVAELNHN